MIKQGEIDFFFFVVEEEDNYYLLLFGLQLDRNRSRMNDVEYRRARHVITENLRTLHTVQALEQKDYVRAGQLMYESHISMDQDYEISTEELNALVDLAKSFPGVYGSRLKFSFSPCPPSFAFGFCFFLRFVINL